MIFFKLPFSGRIYSYFKFPPMGEGGGHIGPAPFFSLSAWLTVADSPHAGG
jgi:hypothetical protein